MKLTITRNTTVQKPVVFSHHGLHLKREYGGPPWWRHINGVAVRLPRRRLLWIELFKAHRRGPLFRNAVAW